MWHTRTSLRDGLAPSPSDEDGGATIGRNWHDGGASETATDVLLSACVFASCAYLPPISNLQGESTACAGGTVGTVMLEYAQMLVQAEVIEKLREILQPFRNDPPVMYKAASGDVIEQDWHLKVLIGAADAIMTWLEDGVMCHPDVPWPMELQILASKLHAHVAAHFKFLRTASWTVSRFLIGAVIAPLLNSRELKQALQLHTDDPLFVRVCVGMPACVRTCFGNQVTANVMDEIICDGSKYHYRSGEHGLGWYLLSPESSVCSALEFLRELLGKVAEGTEYSLADEPCKGVNFWYTFTFLCTG